MLFRLHGDKQQAFMLASTAHNQLVFPEESDMYVVCASHKQCVYPHPMPLMLSLADLRRQCQQTCRHFLKANPPKRGPCGMSWRGYVQVEDALNQGMKCAAHLSVSAT